MSCLCDIAFCISTFERSDCCRRLIRSIRMYYRTARIYVADDSERETRFVGANEVFRLPFNSGLSAKRNRLVDRTTEPYLLFLDDDFVFTDRTCIERLRIVLYQEFDAGLCAGAVEDLPYEGHFRWEGSSLHFDGPAEQTQYASGVSRGKVTAVRYGICDMTTNFFLARRELFDDIRWDERRKLGEHLPFFLELQKTPWRVAFTRSVRIDHRPKQTAAYMRYRKQTKPHLLEVMDEWGIEQWHKFNSPHIADREFLREQIQEAV